jgi:hypothetical protein
MSTFLSTIIGMCGCNKGIRGRVAGRIVGHVVSHATDHIASPRTIPNRVSRAHYIVPEQAPEPVQVQVQESVQVHVQEPVVERVSVQRFPPRIVRGRIVLPATPEPVQVQEQEQLPPRVSRRQFISPVSHFPSRPVNQRFRGIPQRPYGHVEPPAPTSIYNAETTVWGPMLWKVLHTLAEFNTDAGLWNELFTQLTKDIPCVICRTHFTAYVNTQPLTSFDTVSIINWFFT